MSMHNKISFTFHEVFTDADFSCNRKEESFRYFQNLLSDKDAKSFKQHLRICSLCADILVELQEAIEAGELMTIDPRKADEIFQKTRLKLENCLVLFRSPTK